MFLLTVRSLPGDLSAAANLAKDLLAQKKNLENLDNVLAMPKKIHDIQKKIALTRNVANSVCNIINHNSNLHVPFFHLFAFCIAGKIIYQIPSTNWSN